MKKAIVVLIVVVLLIITISVFIQENNPKAQENKPLVIYQSTGVRSENLIPYILVILSGTISLIHILNK